MAIRSTKSAAFAVAAFALLLVPHAAATHGAWSSSRVTTGPNTYGEFDWCSQSILLACLRGTSDDMTMRVSGLNNHDLYCDGTYTMAEDVVFTGFFVSGGDTIMVDGDGSGWSSSYGSGTAVATFDVAGVSYQGTFEFGSAHPTGYETGMGSTSVGFSLEGTNAAGGFFEFDGEDPEGMFWQQQLKEDCPHPDL